MTQEKLKQEEQDKKLTSEVIEAQKVEIAAEDGGEGNGAFIWLIAVTVIACLALGLNLWDKFKPGQQDIRVLDLAGISLTYQQQAKNQGLQDGITNEQRAAILQNYQAKMNTLQQVVQEYVQECSCNIFVKSALVGRNNKVEDITTEIMSRLDKRIPASATVTTSQMPTPNAPLPSTAEGGATPVNVK